MQITPPFTTCDHEAGGSLSINVAYTLDQVIVTLAGDLDLDAEWEVIGTVAAAADSPGVAAMCIDATAVSFIDASGIRTLLTAREVARQHGLAFSLTESWGGPVPRLLRLCRLTEFFPDRAA